MAGGSPPPNEYLAIFEKRLSGKFLYAPFQNLDEEDSKTVITKMSHVLIWVKNQQEALEFYRDKLGFEVDTDAMVGETYRWLTMRIKTQPGFEIILAEPVAGMMLDEESAAQLRSLVDKGVLGGGVFEADDIYKTYDELKARGVEMKGPPTVQSWGTATVMRDNSGNWFSLGQEKEATAAA